MKILTDGVEFSISDYLLGDALIWGRKVKSEPIGVLTKQKHQRSEAVTSLLDFLGQLY